MQNRRLILMLLALIASTTAAAAAVVAAQTTQPAAPEPWRPTGQRPAFGILPSPGVAPCVVHVNGLIFPLAAGTPITARYAWNFDDPQGKFNTLPGFVAAHVYDSPGKYNITLTVTDETGHRESASTTITIAGDHRRQIFVSPDGSPQGIGNSEQTPMRSLERAVELLPDHAEILLKAGGTYPAINVMHLRHTDVLITRYGDGPDPIVSLSKNPNGKNEGFFALDGRCDGVMFDRLTISTPYAVADDAVANKIGEDAIIARGRNITVRDCTFLNVDTAVNANGSPTGLLVQGCRSPLKTGLRAYLVWGQGTDLVYLGNIAANSTREHIVRLSGVDRALIYGNDFANLDRRPADRGDFSKGAIEMHHGSYACIANNTVTDGTIRVGPLGLHELPSTATDWAVIENNVVRNTYIVANPGSHHIMIRGNIVFNDKLQCIQLMGPDKDGRTSGDIHILNNTAIDRGTTGAFLKVWGHINGIELKNNLLVAPNLNIGNSGAAFVNTNETDLKSFTRIADNVWPLVTHRTHGNGFLLANHAITPAEWAAFAQVKSDTFADVRVDEAGNLVGDEKAVQHAGARSSW
jgi:PKD repeat protein